MRRLALLFVLFSLFAGARAEAAELPSQGLTLWGIADFASDIGVGLGARYAIPIQEEGFIPFLKDGLQLEFGADLYRHPGGSSGFRWQAIEPAIGVGYFLQAKSYLVVYARAEAGVTLADYLADPAPAHHDAFDRVFVGGHAGAIIRLTDGIGLRAELGSNATLASRKGSEAALSYEGPDTRAYRRSFGSMDLKLGVACRF